MLQKKSMRQHKVPIGRQELITFFFKRTDCACIIFLEYILTRCFKTIMASQHCYKQDISYESLS